uniref:B30.2/SPRY domain-containing protein n=1 Tax=Pygocentrus nattereri TaxID=42514 RepID=A0A3B4DBN5_PYGNA
MSSVLRLLSSIEEFSNMQVCRFLLITGLNTCIFSISCCLLLNGFKLCLFLSVVVTLDSETAYPDLFVSDDGKQVTYGDTEQNLPDNPERFDQCSYVLGKEGFSSGRLYYEVQVRGKTKWDLGVIRESSNRKGDIKPSPDKGHWSVSLSNETEYKALDSPRVSLSLKQAPQKVGVFVDYEEVRDGLDFITVSDKAESGCLTECVQTFSVTSLETRSINH